MAYKTGFNTALIKATNRGLEQKSFNQPSSAAKSFNIISKTYHFKIANICTSCKTIPVIHKEASKNFRNCLNSFLPYAVVDAFILLLLSYNTGN